MFESTWKKSNSGERDSASAIARCGMTKIEMSWMLPTPMPVACLNRSIDGVMAT